MRALPSRLSNSAGNDTPRHEIDYTQSCAANALSLTQPGLKSETHLAIRHSDKRHSSCSADSDQLDRNNPSGSRPMAHRYRSRVEKADSRARTCKQGEH